MFVPILVIFALVAQCVTPASIPSTNEDLTASQPVKTYENEGKIESSPVPLKTEQKHDDVNTDKIYTPQLESHGNEPTSTTPKTAHVALTSDGVKDLKLHQNWNRNHNNNNGEPLKTIVEDKNAEIPEVVAGNQPKIAQ